VSLGRLRRPRYVRKGTVNLDIEDYQDMLERLEDLDDLKTLEQMRKRQLSFRTLDEFLKEYRPRV
jgi:hypothetical protein